MRVAYVCLDPGIPVFGSKGSSIHCQQVISEMLRRGIQVDLFARRLGGDANSIFKNERLRVHHLTSRSGMTAADREQHLAKLNPITYDAMTQAGPFDLVYERYSLWNNAAMRFAANNGVPGILEVNSPLIHEQKTYRQLHDEALAKTIRGQSFAEATSIIAVSDQVAQRLRCNYFAKDKTTVVPNGVDPNRFAPKLAGKSNAPITVGFVGTLKPWHGVSILLDSLQLVAESHPNCRLKIVGDGPERDRLHDKVAKFPVAIQNSIEWIGTVGNGAIPDLLSSFDIAVAPYPDLQDFYFSPLKILEYMAAGLPIVASEIGQIPELLDHGAAGVLAKSGSASSLAEAIVELIRHPDRRQQLGTSARRRAIRHYSWKQAVDRILDTVSLNPESVAVKR